jgi:hypothetical protein
LLLFTDDPRAGGGLARLGRLLAGAPAGGALVIRGEAGIGKSALLNRIDATATDMSVLRGVGIESEIEVPFATLVTVAPTSSAVTPSAASPHSRGISRPTAPASLIRPTA